MPTTLDIDTRRIILHVKDIILNGILSLEGNDGQKYQVYFKNYTLGHLPIEGILQPELAVVLKNLPCFICNKKKVWQPRCGVTCANKTNL